MKDIHNISRVEPNLVEYEEIILGALLTFGKDFMNYIFEVIRLRAEHFFFPKHALFYEQIQNLFYLQKREPSLCAFNNEIREKDNALFEKLGGHGGIASIYCKWTSAMPKVSPPEFFYDYAQQIIKMWKYRAFIRLAYDLADRSFSRDDIDDVFASSIAELNSVYRSYQSSNPLVVSLSDHLMAMTEKVEKAVDEGIYPEKKSIDTHLVDLNEVTNGIPVGGLTVIAGRAAMGKSTVAISLSQQIAKQESFKKDSILYFSLEMTAQEVVAKMLCSELGMRGKKSGLTPNKLINLDQRFNQEDLVDFISVLDIADQNYWISDRPTITPGTVKAAIQMIKQQRGTAPKLIIIDYLGLMEPDVKSQYNNKAQEVAAITKELREIAKQEQVAIVVLSQLNRECEASRDKRPQLHYLANSGSIEQEASLVIGLFREEYYKELEKNFDPDTQQPLQKLEFFVLKNRFGRTGIVKSLFEPFSGKIVSYAGN